MSEAVVRIKSNAGKIVNYLPMPKVTKYNKSNYLFLAQHKCRVKQALFGEIFTYYHPDMDFSNSETITTK